MAQSKDFIVKNGIVVQNTATIQSILNSTSTTSGALQVSGGIGIGGNVIAGGYGKFTGSYDDTASTSTLGVYLGVVGTTSSPRIGFASSGTLWQLDNYNGNFRWTTLNTVRMQIDTTGVVTVFNSTQATSTNTGALVIQGGVGIWRDVYIGGTLNVAGGFAGNVTTATNVANGTAGQLHYQVSPGQTSFAGPGTAGQILLSNGTSAPIYTSTSSISVNASQYSGTATNISGGVAGQLHYQTGPNATSFVSTASAGQVLISNGSNAPVYQNTLTLAGSTPTGSTNTGALQVAGGVGIGGSLYVGGTLTATGTLHYFGSVSNPVVIDTGQNPRIMYAVGAGMGIAGGGATPSLSTPGLMANNAGSLDLYGGGNNINLRTNTNSGTIVLSTGNAISTATGSFQVRGGAGVALDLWVGGTIYTKGWALSTSTGGASFNGGTSTNIVNIANTTSAVSSSTGALQVAGGASVRGDLYVGGRIISYSLPLVANDISYQFNSVRTIFPLKNNQSPITGIVDNKDLMVFVDGRKIAPYVAERGFPWINTYNSFKGFRVVTTGTTATYIVFYNAPELGTQADITLVNTSANRQVRSYPYSATTIALGD